MSESRNTCIVPGTHDVVISLIDLPSGSTILDLGCYQGSMSVALIERGYTVMSCDVVAHPGTETLPHFQLANANESLPYTNDMFDAVVCTDVIEHLENPTRLITECARVLKKNGNLVLSTPNVSNSLSRLTYALTGEFPLFHEYHFKEWTHMSPISMSWIKFTAQKYGLKVENITSEGFSDSGPRRKLAFYILYPFFYAFTRRQSAALCSGKILIVKMRKV